MDCLSTDTAKAQEHAAIKVMSPAFKLMRVDKVQVLLFVQEGTFASTSDLTVSGRDFKSSWMKYRAPI